MNVEFFFNVSSVFYLYLVCWWRSCIYLATEVFFTKMPSKITQKTTLEDTYIDPNITKCRYRFNTAVNWFNSVKIFRGGSNRDVVLLARWAQSHFIYSYRNLRNSSSLQFSPLFSIRALQFCISEPANSRYTSFWLHSSTSSKVFLYPYFPLHIMRILF